MIDRSLSHRGARCKFAGAFAALFVTGCALVGASAALAGVPKAPPPPLDHDIVFTKLPAPLVGGVVGGPVGALVGAAMLGGYVAFRRFRDPR